MSDPKKREQGAGALKACPFCGGKADVDSGGDDETFFIAYCTNDNCIGHLVMTYIPYQTSQQAIDAWNARTPDSERIAELERDVSLLKDERGREYGKHADRTSELERELERLKNCHPVKAIEGWKAKNAELKRLRAALTDCVDFYGEGL
jgi:hypothetical protein